MDLVIFDLDGTLIDSERDLVESVNATRAFMKLEPLDNATIASYVGNGAPVLMRRAMGPEMPQEQVDAALLFFLGYYREHCLDYTVLYPGMRETLDKIHGSGARLAVLTNKPVKVSKRITQGLGIHDLFVDVYGGDSFAQKKPDPVGIETLLKDHSVARDRTLMVGDSPVDVQTARNAGVFSCGVMYGFQPEGLKSDPPDVLCGHAGEIAEWVLARRDLV